jgi:hypothetical protein
MDLLEHGGLARTGGGNQNDKAVGQPGSLVNTLYDSFGD